MTTSNKTPARALSLPQINVTCPQCSAPAGALCTSHGGTRTRRNDTHTTRRAAWVAAGKPTAPMA